jgi:tetratricopeptide (TPR) repeat protein
LFWPFDPQIEVIEAMRLREQLQRMPIAQWDEGLYRRACEAYRRAQSLDPYDPLHPMHLAQLQQLAERGREAVQTLQRALTFLPRSEPILEMLFIQARQQGDYDLARRSVAWALAVDPASAKWWRRRYETEAAAGRGPEAGLALNTALTADPENAYLIGKHFDRREMSLQAMQR